MTTERYGSGPTLLLIHGSPGSSQTWRSIGKKLADHYSIVAPTLPGHGPGNALIVQETSDVAAATLAALGKLPGPVTIAAHSFGAVIALQMALSGTLDIARMVLFEPVAFAILPATGECDQPSRCRGEIDRGPLTANAPRTSWGRGRFRPPAAPKA